MRNNSYTGVEIITLVFLIPDQVDLTISNNNHFSLLKDKIPKEYLSVIEKNVKSALDFDESISRFRILGHNEHTKDQTYRYGLGECIPFVYPLFDTKEEVLKQIADRFNSEVSLKYCKVLR